MYKKGNSLLLLYLLITYPDGLLEATSPDSQDWRKERERKREIIWKADL